MTCQMPDAWDPTQNTNGLLETRAQRLLPLPPDREPGHQPPPARAEFSPKSGSSLQRATTFLAALFLGLTYGWSQVPPTVVHPAHITGQVTFNSDPAIAARLAGGGRFLWLYATSQAPGPALTTSTAIGSPGAPLTPPFHFDLVVEAAPLGSTLYAYTVGGRLIFFYGPTSPGGDASDDEQEYYLAGGVSPVLSEADTVTLNLNECAALLDIHFKYADGTDANTSGGGQIFAKTTDLVDPAGYQAGNDGRVPAGTGYKLLVRSGHTYQLSYNLATGTDPMLDRQQFSGTVDIPGAVGCGEVRTVTITLPAVSAVGKITGTLNMVGETAVPQGVPHVDAPYTLASLIAAKPLAFDFDHPWYLRYSALSGTPAPGVFELPNLLPGPFWVQGRMQFRPGRGVNLFRTPILSTNVPPNGVVPLGNAFVMTPGSNRGQVLLQGPVESGGAVSPLRYLQWAVNDSAPNGNAWNIDQFSCVRADGLGTVPPSGSSAAGGLGFCEFNGAVRNDGSGDYLGNYELMLAGLSGLPSAWDIDRLDLRFDSRPSGVAQLVQGGVQIFQHHPVTVNPGGLNTYDLNYCFGEVRLQLHATSGTLFQPLVIARDEGTGATYSTATFYGTPYLQAEAQPDGEVVLVLPAGQYTLIPEVNILGSDGGVNNLILPAVPHVQVTCRGGMTIPPSGLVVNVTPPACANPPSVHISGSVAGTANVAKIIWDRGDGVTNTICTGCGLNPNFGFDLPVNSPCQAYTFTVTAEDVNGQFAATTITIPADRTAPAITCPTNITITCASPNGALASYPAPVVTDNCDPNPVVSCSPSSGTWFLPGNTTVTCTATDRCGNSNSCTFTVTVTTNCPPSPCIDLHCSTNLTAYAPCGSNCVSVPFTVWTSDRCSTNPVPVVTDYPSGYCFPLGTTWVNATATANGQSTQCSFSVTVLPDPNCGNGCSTNLLINGSFETPGIPDGYVALAPGDSIIQGWITTLKGIEWFNPVVAPSFVNTGFAADGNYLVELTPANSVGGGIAQTFNTQPKTYTVSFALGTSKERGRNGTATVTVTVAGITRTFTTATTNPFITWERKQFSFDAPGGPVTLSFASLDDPATSYVDLDDVRVSDCCTDAGLAIKRTITVEWKCGILQSANSVNGPYTDVPGASSPYTVDATGPQRYFRTR